MNPEYFIENSKKLDERIASLKQREIQLVGLSDEQNVQFEKLRKGYAHIGIIDNRFENEFITKQSFQDHLLDIEKKYKNSKTENKADSTTVLERYISSKISLIGNRWNSICQDKKIWFSELAELRNSESELITTKYFNLEKLAEKIPESEWKSNAESLFQEHNKILSKQEKYMIALEEQQNELEAIYRLREELYDLAVEQFTK